MTSSPTLPKVREYRLQLDVDFSGLRFRGAVEADLTGVEGPVVLDAVGLTAGDASVNGRPAPCEARPEQEMIVLPSVPPGDATVRVAFDGHVIAGGLMGLYRSRYGESYILTTQCAPTDARRIFPCIDRPDRKAPLRLTLTVPSDVDVIFNTPVEEESREGPRKTLVFARTPPMATYLFYLGIGDFDRHAGPPGRVRIATYAPPGRAAEGAFASDHAARLLPAFEEYYAQPYPLPKLDLVAVPEFAYGAMENWGAISFRESQLLVSPATSTRVRRHTLDTLAHEIAHQWFGNLVTMQWWDDIWLNESFATFLEMKMVDRLYPTHGSLENLLTYWTNRTLFADSLASTRPVAAEIHDPSEIPQRFDDITYGKGAAILRMLEGYLGEEKFRAGIADYLARFRYGNARSQDLWEALDRAAGEAVQTLLRPWLERPGLPLLSVRQESPGLVVRQRRFHLTGGHTDEFWPVPLVAEINGEVRRVRFEAARLEIPVPDVRSLHFNPNAAGFYRVLYDPTLYERVLEQYPRRTPLEQWATVQDLFAFLFSGDVGPELYARFVSASQGLTNYLPARQITEDLVTLHQIVGRHPVLAPAAQAFLQAQYRRLGSRRRPDEPELDGVLRERVTFGLLTYDESFLRELAAQFPARASVDPDLRPAVAVAFSSIGGAGAHVALRQAAESAASDSEAMEISVALACSRDPALVEATFRLLDDGVLNRAHLPQIVRAASLNRLARGETWQWIQRRLEAIGRESRGTLFSSYVYEYALPYVGLGRRAEVEAWVRAHPVIEGERGAAKGFALLDATEALRRRLIG